MLQCRCTFLVNGRRTEQIVSAYNPHEARQIILSMYGSANVQIITIVPA